MEVCPHCRGTRMWRCVHIVGVVGMGRCGHIVGGGEVCPGCRTQGWEVCPGCRTWGWEVCPG